MNMTGRLESASLAKQYLTGGNATVTLRSLATGDRFTYRVRKAEDKVFYFVSLLTGQDNESDFRYLGVIDNNGFRFTHKSFSQTSNGAKGFDWFAKILFSQDRMPQNVELWHEGKCGRCGRKLTVPESVEQGFGPECIERIGMK